MKRAATLALAFVLATCASISSTWAGDVIRIGVLNDQSGVFADNGGIGSIAAARLAAEDFGNNVIGTAGARWPF